MTRLFILLPFCLLLGGKQSTLEYLPTFMPAQQLTTVAQSATPCRELMAGLACGSANFPANLSWLALLQISTPNPQAIEKLLKEDPCAFLRLAIARYQREIRGYTCYLCKLERLGGKLQAPEEVIAHFREDPQGVRMDWTKLGGSIVSKALYVKGENNNCLVALPAGLLGFIGAQHRALDHPDAKNASRHRISDFGVKLAIQQTLTAMEKAAAAGTLDVRYEGVCNVPQLDNRPCYKLVRKVEPPEDDGVSDLVIYIDTENWLQTSTISRDRDGALIGEYFLKNFVLNPEFPPNLFKVSGL